MGLLNALAAPTSSKTSRNGKRQPAGPTCARASRNKPKPPPKTSPCCVKSWSGFKASARVPGEPVDLAPFGHAKTWDGSPGVEWDEPREMSGVEFLAGIGVDPATARIRVINDVARIGLRVGVHAQQRRGFVRSCHPLTQQF